MNIFSVCGKWKGVGGGTFNVVFTSLSEREREREREIERERGGRG